MNSFTYISYCPQSSIVFFYYNKYNILGNIHAVIVMLGLYIGGRSECVMMVR